MFNFSGSEVIFLLILGLVVLGPEKLPGVLRKAGRLYGEFKRLTSDAQSELRQAFDQPMRDIQSTAKAYQGFFTDAAKEVTKGPEVSAETSPTFIPFEPVDVAEDHVMKSEPSDADEGDPTK